jgi:VCBS repeat-containing protein
LNFIGKFDEHFPLDCANSGDRTGYSATHSVDRHRQSAEALAVSDANLLFGGHYSRAGADLVISGDQGDHRVVVPDYFAKPTRPWLSSPDGARLSPETVRALVGEVQVAQATGTPGTDVKVIGQVSKLTGTATVIRNGVEVQLNIGDAVYKGDVVQAGASSSIALTFIDGTVFGLSANARMVLNEMVYDPNGSSNSAMLSLVQGTISFVAGETAKHGDMKVQTPVATMGIRGTAVLVQIAFEIPGQGGAPPVQFQVLVEPGNQVGEFLLYSLNDPTTVIGTVNNAGQVTTVTGSQSVTTTTAPPLPVLAQDIITFTLQQFFPGYVPDLNPRSGGPGSGSSTPPGGAGQPDSDAPKFQQVPELPIGLPTPIPIKLQNNSFDTPLILATVTRFNTAPVIVVKTVSDTPSFHVGDQVTITDPDSTNPDFLDTFVPYIPGSGAITSVSGPASGQPLAGLVSIDPVTGNVSYDPAAFAFLREGDQVQVTVAFDSRSGPDTVHESLTLTINGVNDAPAVTAPLTTNASAGDEPTTVDLLQGASDPDSGETDTLTVGNVRYAVGDGIASATVPAGLSRTGATLTVDPNDPAFMRLAEGQSETIVVSYDVTDVHGATTTQIETVTVNGVNDAPAVAAPLTTNASAGDAATTVDLLQGASDPDRGETDTLTVANVRYAVGDGIASATAPAGVSLAGATLTVDPADASFAHLAEGATETIVVSYVVSDVHGVSVAQTETITVTGINDAPVVTASTVTSRTPWQDASGLSPVAAAILADPNSDLIGDLPGGGESEFGMLAMTPNDDGSSAPIDITSVFGVAGLNFFGSYYTSLYINNNGNITFGAASGVYTPGTIGASTNPMIAAFWADVDTRAAGHVSYDLDPVDGVMTITWDQVGYYNRHSDHTNSFQIVLLNEGGGNFDIVYRYADINWTTGDASGGSGGLGGTVAHVGYSAGDGVHYYELPQSGHQSQILSLPNDDPVHFQVRNGTVTETLAVDGTLAFTDADTADTHSAMFAAVDGGTGYIGDFALTGVTEANGSGTVGWTFGLPAATVAALTTAVTQAYDITIDDHHNGAVTQRVEVSIGTANSDTFVFHSGFGSDVITNFVTTGNAADVVELEGFDIDSHDDLAAMIGENSNHDAVLTLGHDSITFSGVTASQLNQALDHIHLGYALNT